MSSAGALWVRRPTEMTSTPLAAISATVSSDTPPDASVTGAAGDQADGIGQHRRVHVVEQQDVDAGAERFLDLVDAVDFAADF